MPDFTWSQTEPLAAALWQGRHHTYRACPRTRW